MKLKAGSLRRKTKLKNHQPDLSRKTGRRTQINRIRNKEEVTTDIAEIQRTMRAHYKQLYANKMDNLKDMYKFLEKHNLPRLNQEEIENINRSITSTEIERKQQQRSIKLKVSSLRK